MAVYQDGTSSPLKQTRRFITKHDENGKATFFDAPGATDEVQLKRSDEAAFSVIYHTRETPVITKNDKDLNTHLNPPTSIPIAVKNGSVLRMVDVSPRGVSPMHRTNSLDYGVVLEGEVELILDNFEIGPRRVLRPGDVSIQRATNHAWRNCSNTEWARMLYVLLEATDGESRDEDWGGIKLPE